MKSTFQRAVTTILQVARVAQRTPGFFGSAKEMQQAYSEQMADADDALQRFACEMGLQEGDRLRWWAPRGCACVCVCWGGGMQRGRGFLCLKVAVVLSRQEAPQSHCRRVRAHRARPTGTNRIHLVLLGMQNRTFDPCLAAIVASMRPADRRKAPPVFAE
jgi:hypothetical protein